MQTKHKSVKTYFEHGLLEIMKYQANRQENHAPPKETTYWMFRQCFKSYIKVT